MRGSLISKSRPIRTLPPWATWVLCLLLGFCAANCGELRPAPAPAQTRKTPLPPPQKPVNYSEPPREYEAVPLNGRTIQVERQLLSDSPDLAKQALGRLEQKLGEAFAALPESSHDNLKKLQLFLMYGPNAKGGGRDNGLEYFQKNAPECYRTLDPRWGSSVVIYSAENYVWISDFWALKALVHEFAHAHQLEQWPEDQPDIYQAWEKAMSRGLYRNVRDEQGKTLEKAWATVNQLEYFAELSCMYFVGCNCQPFNRKELKTYDPTGYAVVEKMWGARE